MSRPLVQTAAGALRGVEDGGLAVFRGIPYAQPPVGDLRFRAPRPLAPWGGERDASAFGPASMQPTQMLRPPSPVSGMFGPDDIETSEDCLYLNVWTPALGESGARCARPVMVWIHGGAFRTGHGGSPMYDGAALARRGDVVVVTINYRLGALGFLYEPALGGANFGLLDQVAALEWVRDHIAAFGGDPGNVTIFGESAGGKSVETLLATPRARGLFHRAIAQSTYDPPMLPEQVRPNTLAILAELGIAEGDAEALRAAPAEAILEAQANVTMAAMAAGGRTANGATGAVVPVIDGDVLPSKPLDAIAAGAVADVPLLIGTTKDETRLFLAMQPNPRDVDEAGLVARLAANEPDEAARRRTVEAYREARAERGLGTSPFELLGAINTDQTFRTHSVRVAEAQRAHQPQTYMYLFAWEARALDGLLGACHGLELPFVFHTLDTPMGRLAGDVPEAHALAERMQDAWIAFARTGDPNTSSLPPWPPYDLDRRATMRLDATCDVVDAPMEAERLFWASKVATAAV